MQIAFQYDFPETVDIRNKQGKFWAIRIKELKYQEQDGSILAFGTQVPGSGVYQLHFPINLKQFRIVQSSARFTEDYKQLLTISKQAPAKMAPPPPSAPTKQPEESDFDYYLRLVLSKERDHKSAISTLAQSVWVQ